MTLKEVTSSALALPRRSRAKLLRDLASSLEDKHPGPPGSEMSEQEWIEEIERRVQEIDRGEAKLVPGAVVMKWLRRRAK